MAGNKTLDLTIRIAGKMDKSLLSAINGTQSRVSDLARTVSRVGTAGLAAMGALATGTVAALAQCTDAAKDFESQMSNVVKYVGGLADANGKISGQMADNGKTYAQNYAAMTDAILDLSTQIPMTAEELTQLAAAAGQSGKTISDLRAFAYGGSHNRIIYDPEMKPALNMNADEYQRHISTTINHFYEKLFQLKDLMNTDTARKIAEQRENYMKIYISEFLDEWDGIR